ncbi:hypothetical protein [Pedobacter frigoris]|uniref:Uncharacterized protein n=1 Tax=Pedobacter frigoris TaxID=2571272 RepID=A0A4U1CIZ8_9SPHI|nr:hypothetical protein [Pedobacter frigoris]TKC06960.1 hypothetical protein FA047_06725 [Pedobacter frigoris]
MKKISLITAILLLLNAYSYGQKGKVQTTTIKGRGNALDTVVTRKTELSFNKNFPNSYKKKESVVQTLRPYLVSEIVDPRNHSHPIYSNHVRDAREKLPEAKAALLQHIKTSSSYKEYMNKYNIASEADLNSITFVHIPMYYITPNIVFFQNSENVAKYYNLGTGGLKYLMLKNNSLIGYLDFYNSKSVFREIPKLLTESYYQIKRLGKSPIMLSQSISTSDPKKIIGGINMFGYVDQGHLIFSMYEEGTLQKNESILKKRVFRKDYVLQTAGSFLSDEQGAPAIQQWLNTKINSLKKRP